MRHSNPTVLAFDVGGTGTKIGLIHPSGEISGFRRIPTDARGTEPAPFVQRLFTELDTLVDTAGRDTLLGVGASMHGEVDSERRGPIIAGNTPALRGFDMRGALEHRYGLPVALNNDLIAHAHGEYRFGCGEGVSRFMCMAIGTGLGAAMLVDGTPIITLGGNSGNTGLIIIDPTGPLDSNGVRGSAEALCGVPGIERLARERMGRDLPAHAVIAAAREGSDPAAVEVMQQIGRWLGQALASLSVIFYPRRIALTGGTASTGDVLLHACRAQFDHLAGDFFRDLEANTGGEFSNVEIVLGEGGSETGLKGAAVELFQQHGL